MRSTLQSTTLPPCAACGQPAIIQLDIGQPFYCGSCYVFGRRPRRRRFMWLVALVVVVAALVAAVALWGVPSALLAAVAAPGVWVSAHDAPTGPLDLRADALATTERVLTSLQEELGTLKTMHWSIKREHGLDLGLSGELDTIKRALADLAGRVRAQQSEK